MVSNMHLFNVDADAGAETRWHQHADGSVTIEEVQHVEPLLEINKAVSHETTGWKGDMHRVASLPMIVYLDLKKRGILKDKKRLHAWLNDPDNAAFRTRTGRI